MHETAVAKIISSLKRGSRGGRERPHKPIMWLAVLHLIDRGYIRENQIHFDSELKKEFSNLLSEYALEDDLDQPAPPFFHLRSSGIWHHKIKSGEESYYAGLTTSGGGNLRVDKSIEFAYLDDKIFDAISESSVRNQLKTALITLLRDEGRGARVSKRIGTLFHESFSLSRPGVAAVLRQAGGTDSQKELIDKLCEEENLGRNWAKAVPAYARGCGFLDFGSTELTPLGAHVLEHDADLHLPETLWLMHYHLSAPHGPGPRFWHDLTLRLPELAQPVTREAVTSEIDRSVREDSGAELKERGLATTATVFLGSYSKSDALGPLGVLQEREEGLVYESPEAPPAGVVGYALSHYWQGQLGAQQTCSLDDLGAPGGFGSLFFMSSFSVNRALRQLSKQGVLELWMAAPPYQVTRPPVPEKLLDGIYASE